MITIEVYIKKNTKIKTGIVAGANAIPYTTFTDTVGGFTVNQYKGFYIKITSGTGVGSVSWILSNTINTLTLETPIQVDATTKYNFYKSAYNRLDLNKDERITITSEIKNINDLGKVFTDYSRSLSVPASDNNNAIFSHWYENSVDDGFDQRVRYDGYIKINTVTFKTGIFQLEKANKKDGQIESYTITFYGKVKQIKDILKDDKLSALNYSSIGHTYSSAEVRSRITSDLPIKYPLIGSQKKYEYQTGTANDITLIGGAIKWDDLFPAVKITDIFLFIKNKYGIEFTGGFLFSYQWTRLHLYFKNTTKMFARTSLTLLDFTAVTVGPFTELNLVTDTITLSWNWAVGGTARNVNFSLKITPTVLTIPYTLIMYKDGIAYATFPNLISITTTSVIVYESDIAAGAIFTYKVQSESAIVYNLILNYRRGYTFANATNNIISTAIGNGTTASNIDLSQYAPDMKIIDFITGLLKVFNLVIIPKSETIFDLVPLETFYTSGKSTDITKYILSQDADIEKSKMFNSIKFAYQESETILNKKYKELYGVDYGSLIYNNPASTETSTFELVLPFENVLFDKVLNKEFITATLIDKDLNPVTPKPMLIYFNDYLLTPLVGLDQIYVTNSGGVSTQINNYKRFSVEYNANASDPTLAYLMSNCFGNEQSIWYNVYTPKGLFYRHYNNIIANLYDLKTRVLKVKALLPISLLSTGVKNGYGAEIGIKLNERLIIRNKRYLINSMTQDLNTGETSFDLITDYRGVNAVSTVGFRYASVQNFTVDNTAQVVETVFYLNDFDSFDVAPQLNFTIVTRLTGVKEDTLISITIPANATLLTREDWIVFDCFKNGVLTKIQLMITQLL